MYWKSKVRILQLWSNFKLYNFGNSYIAPIIASIGPVLGMIWSFSLGFGLAYAFKYFFSESSYYLWQFVFLLSIYESVVRGIQNGRWISSTNEEKWLLSSTPFSTKKYLFFLWIDEELWQGKSKLFSSIAGLIGIYIIFPINIFILCIALFFLFLLGNFIALIFTLIQYYIIRKSSNLKGRGIISNLISPAITTIFVFTGVQFFTPWILSFPKINTNGLYYVAYIEWGKEILTPLWSFLKEFSWVFEQSYFPFTLLTDFLLNGIYENLIYFSFYLFTLIIINFYIFKLISLKDHNNIVKIKTFDQMMLNILLRVDKFLSIFIRKSIDFIHLKLFLLSLLQNYLTKRNILVIFGGGLWVYSAIIVSLSLNVPVDLQEKTNIILAIIATTIYPVHFLWAVYNKLKIKLSFESEGVFLQILTSYGMSSEYMLALKTRALRVLALPGYVTMLTLTLILLKLHWVIILFLLFLSFVIFLTVSKFIILPSFLIPHYEFFNKQQIGDYPDQKKMVDLIQSLMSFLITPAIPILMYLTNSLSYKVFLIMAIGWIVIGIYILKLFLNKIMIERIHNFHEEEISLSRKKETDSLFWSTKIPVLLITALVYGITIVLTMFGELVLASILFVIPMCLLKLILISSFKKNQIKNIVSEV